MKSIVCLYVALALAALPGPAIAQVTQSYSYDANGRLTGVTTTGSAGTNTAAYVYDDANNRLSRSQAGTAAYATLSPPDSPDTLRPDQTSGSTQLLARTPTIGVNGRHDASELSRASRRQDPVVERRW